MAALREREREREGERETDRQRERNVCKFAQLLCRNTVC